MTPRHHRVGPGVWKQPWDDDMRLVAFYLLTCKHRVTEGLYVLPPAYGPADMRWEPTRFEPAFALLQGDGFIQYDVDAEVVWVVNALQWQQPQNPNQVKAAIKALDELPRTRLFDRFLAAALTVSDPKVERFQEGLRERFGERLPEPIANTPSPAPSPAPESDSPAVDGRARTSPLDALGETADHILGVLQRGVDGLTGDGTAKQPTKAAVLKVLRNHPTTRDVAVAAAVEARSIAQSQNRAPNIVALYEQKLGQQIRDLAPAAAAA